MHPLKFIKAHPLASILLPAAGMIAGPWILGKINGMTGVNVSLPVAGGSS